MPGYLVSSGAVSDVADVQMTRQDHVDTALRKSGNRHLRTPDDISLRLRPWHVVGMMGDDDAGDMLTAPGKPGTAARYLVAVYVSILESPRTRRVDAQDRYLVVCVERGQRSLLM